MDGDAALAEELNCFFEHKPPEVATSHPTADDSWLSQQQLHFLRVLLNNNLAKELLVSFYRRSVESKNITLFG